MSKIKLRIVSFDYVDDDILCVEIKDDRGVIYSGSLEREDEGGD